MLIKKKRLEEAERELAAAKKALENEQELLKKAMQVLQEVLDHKQEKLTQLRQELDGGTTSDVVEKMKRYLETVEDKRKDKDAKVKKQQLEVEKAEQVVEDARQNLLKKQADVEKLTMHFEEWQKEQLYLEKQEEAKHTEEMGTVMHVRKKPKKRDE